MYSITGLKLFIKTCRYWYECIFPYLQIYFDNMSYILTNTFISKIVITLECIIKKSRGYTFKKSSTVALIYLSLI